MTKLNLKKGNLKGAVMVGVIPANYLVPSKISEGYIADHYEELRWERDFLEEYEMQRDIERIVSRSSNF